MDVLNRAVSAPHEPRKPTKSNISSRVISTHAISARVCHFNPCVSFQLVQCSSFVISCVFNYRTSVEQRCLLRCQYPCLLRAWPLSTQPRLYEVSIKYMDHSCALWFQVTYVMWGPAFVTLCFLLLANLARGCAVALCAGRRGSGDRTGLPQSFSRFVCALGIAAAVDPVGQFVVDLCAGNNNCATRCVEYTSSSCRCHEGDAWKLYMALKAKEGAGIVGVLITVMVRYATRQGRKLGGQTLRPFL